MGTVLASMRWPLVRLLARYGVDAQAIYREQGVNLSAGDSSARISSDITDAVITRAAAVIKDTAFGLQVAHCWHPSDLGAVGYAWLASSTLRTGLKRLERYGRIVADKGKVITTNVQEGLRLAFESQRRDAVLRTAMADIIISLTVDMCRMNYGASLRPAEVRLSRPHPEDAEPYRAFYGCQVRFDDETDSVLFSKNVVDKVLPSANRQLAGTLDQILTQQLAVLDKRDIPGRCRAQLLDQLSSGEPSVGSIAKQLNMSSRTLQRKLSEADTTYEKLVDETRRDMALRYVEATDKSIIEIAFMLGFANQSAFTRAFKRWTGLPPSGYRAKNSVSP